MEVISDKPLDGVGQEVVDTPEVQPLTQENQIRDSEKELQAEYTRTRQSLIDMTAELVEANPKKLESIDDIKLRNSVVKKLYGVDSLAELKAIHGEKYWESGDDLDDVEKLRRDFNKLKLITTREKEEMAIESFKSANPTLFKEQDAMEKLNKALDMLSKDIPHQERIKAAATIAFGSSRTNATNDAYKALAITEVKANGGISAAPIEKKGDAVVENKLKAITDFFNG